MFTVFGMADSGNCYKMRLVLEQLNLPYRWVEVYPGRGDTRSPEFLAMNPNGKVPTLQLEDGTFLPESNAILHYLAEGSCLLPHERGAHGHCALCLQPLRRGRRLRPRRASCGRPLARACEVAAAPQADAVNIG